MHTVKEITSFEVPEGKDEEFLKGWNAIAQQMRHAPGMLATHLHESLDPATKFRFVAFTEWESLASYEAARGRMSQAFEALRRKLPFAAYPASYRVVVSAVGAPNRYEMFSR